MDDLVTLQRLARLPPSLSRMALSERPGPYLCDFGDDEPGLRRQTACLAVLPVGSSEASSRFLPTAAWRALLARSEREEQQLRDTGLAAQADVWKTAIAQAVLRRVLRTERSSQAWRDRVLRERRDLEQMQMQARRLWFRRPASASGNGASSAAMALEVHDRGSGGASNAAVVLDARARSAGGGSSATEVPDDPARSGSGASNTVVVADDLARSGSGASNSVVLVDSSSDGDDVEPIFPQAQFGL